jgi:hypothetical protein
VQGPARPWHRPACVRPDGQPLPPAAHAGYRGGTVTRHGPGWPILHAGLQPPAHALRRALARTFQVLSGAERTLSADGHALYRTQSGARRHGRCAGKLLLVERANTWPAHATLSSHPTRFTSRWDTIKPNAPTPTDNGWTQASRRKTCNTSARMPAKSVHSAIGACAWWEPPWVVLPHAARVGGQG